MNILPFRKKKQAVDDFACWLEDELDGLYRVALRYTRDAVQAEDLVHDTAVRALRFRDRFAEGTNFRAWIYTILTNTFIHRYRRQRREREILEGCGRDDVERQLRSQQARDRALHPETVYLNQMLCDDVQAALDDLPEEFRTVVVLCDIEALSYKDIAEICACPVGTVMSRLYRGRRLLERKLAQVAWERGIVKRSAYAEASAVGDEREVVDMNLFRRRKSG